MEELKPEVTKIEEYFHKAELSQLDQLKEVAFEMIKYNKENSEITVTEYETQWFVNVKIAIPKNKKGNASIA